MPLGIFFWGKQEAANFTLITSTELTPCKAITGGEKVPAENMRTLNQMHHALV